MDQGCYFVERLITQEEHPRMRVVLHKMLTIRQVRFKPTPQGTSDTYGPELEEKFRMRY